MYLSTDYNDPLQMVLDPPISHNTGTTQSDIEGRTYLYCSKYDNGAGPGSPPVKRQSESPTPPQDIPIGGPCPDYELQCIGPKQGTLCNGSDATCGSVSGAMDGVCDACPLRGGVTTEDEMFIALGAYYLPNP
jgi:hypothetical protein